MVGLGALGTGVSWYGASGEARDGDQIPWLTLGVAATALAALGLVGWLLTALRQVRLASRHVVATVVWEHRLRQSAAQPGDSVVQTIGSDAAPGAYVTAPTMTRYHRPGCQLVVAKPQVGVTSPGEIAQRGLRSCGVCLDV